jgi:hypothetical protein
MFDELAEKVHKNAVEKGFWYCRGGVCKEIS